MIITKRVIDLSSDELARCRELTYGDEGYMLEDLNAAIHRESSKRHYRYTQAILITESDQIIGWSLLQPVPHSSRYIAYFFVDYEHRKKGIGGKLIKEASKWGKYKLDVMPDWTNLGFFEKFPQLHEGS